MELSNFVVYGAESLGSIPALAHAVMGDTSWNLLGPGRALQRKLEEISERPLLRRTMSTLNTGIGIDHGTGIYREKLGGGVEYDFTFLDQMLDTMVNPHSVPFFGLDFMPLELSSGTSADLTEAWKRLDRFPPKDQGRWFDLVYNIVAHCRDRYGAESVQQWYWDFWNEPDLEFYWLGTLEDFLRTYDTAAAAVKAALPGARFGGIGVTDRRGPWLDTFLEHCSGGVNYHTGAPSVPLDFITFHVKGGPTGRLGRYNNPWEAQDYERRNPSLRQMLVNVRWAMDRIAAYPSLRGTPVFITECDIDFGVSTSIYHNPNLHYRNSAYFPAFQCALVAQLLDLRREYEHNPIEAAFLDTFYFPGYRVFEGQRTLVTGDVIDLPILNGLRVLGQLGDEQLPARLAGGTSSQLASPAVVATRARDGSLRLMAVNFDESFDYAESFQVQLELQGLEAGEWRCRHYRIDQQHSNAYTVWLAMRRPVPPTEEQLAAIQQRMGLELLEPEFQIAADDQGLSLSTMLPAQAVSLWVLRPMPKHNKEFTADGCL
jgi:xylan 1,4-beta-xylosidase